MIRFFRISLAVLMFIPAASAQDASKAPEKSEFLLAVEEFTEGLSPRDARHFNILYGNYNLMKIVEGIRETVGNTVKKCGQEHPDLKERMATRFGVWKEAVNPILKESKANIDNMVVAQDYAEAKEIRKIFKALVKERE